MGRKGSSRGLPPWYTRKGKKLLDAYTGEEIYELASMTRIQEGKYIHKVNYDKLTDKERSESLKNRR